MGQIERTKLIRLYDNDALMILNYIKDSDPIEDLSDDLSTYIYLEPVLQKIIKSLSKCNYQTRVSMTCTPPMADLMVRILDNIPTDPIGFAHLIEEYEKLHHFVDRYKNYLRAS